MKRFDWFLNRQQGSGAKSTQVTAWLTGDNFDVKLDGRFTTDVEKSQIPFTLKRWLSLPKSILTVFTWEATFVENDSKDSYNETRPLCRVYHTSSFKIFQNITNWPLNLHPSMRVVLPGRSNQNGLSKSAERWGFEQKTLFPRSQGETLDSQTLNWWPVCQFMRFLVKPVRRPKVTDAFIKARDR